MKEPREIIWLQVQVTRDDLDNGIRKFGSVCPIALGVKHAVEKQLMTPLLSVDVEGWDIIFSIDGYEYQNFTHHSFINDFVNAFDAEEYVQPFELEIKFEVIKEEDERDYYPDDSGNE